MTEGDAAIRRADAAEVEPELRALLADYLAESHERAREEMDPEHTQLLSQVDAGEIVNGDLAFLTDGADDDALFLAEDGDRAVGCVLFKRLEPAEGEVKRLYVGPSHRGEGLGRGLVEELIRYARERNYETLRLGVGPHLKTAQRLYQDLGFEYTGPYEHSQTPEEFHDAWRFMRLSLAGESG